MVETAGALGKIKCVVGDLTTERRCEVALRVATAMGHRKGDSRGSDSTGSNRKGRQGHAPSPHSKLLDRVRTSELSPSGSTPVSLAIPAVASPVPVLGTGCRRRLRSHPFGAPGSMLTGRRGYFFLRRAVFFFAAFLAFFLAGFFLAFFFAVFFLAVFFLAVFLAGFRLAVFFFAAFFFAMSNSYRGRRPKTLMLTPPSEGATAEEGRNNRCTFSPSV